MGWVAGGAQAVIEALLDVVCDGTIVFPTFTGGLSDPSTWLNPPIPESWWPDVRNYLPAYNPSLSPSRGMGQVAECARTHEHARRSLHPLSSFTAIGKNAELVTARHGLDFRLGLDSPLGALLALDAKILLIGVTHRRNSSLHLAEYRNFREGQPTAKHSAPTLVNGKRQWVQIRDIVFDESVFEKIGNSFEVDYEIPRFRIGLAECALFSQRQIVDYATEWLRTNS